MWSFDDLAIGQKMPKDSVLHTREIFRSSIPVKLTNNQWYQFAKTMCQWLNSNNIDTWDS